jgi:methyl acetate hydrolase
VAALQLVDQGSVSLDSEEDIEKYLPEIGTLKVLEGYQEDDTPILVNAKTKVTLRMLMSHTAGELKQIYKRCVCGKLMYYILSFL